MASSEEKEIQLVDRVDMKILGVANNEDKLQALLKVYLTPLLLKAASPHESVRNKVIAIVQRLKTYVKPAGIVLPVRALLDQFKSTDSSLVKHFDLVFIQHSISRLEPEERQDLISALLHGVSREAGSPNAPVLFNLFLHILPDLRLPSKGTKDDIAFRETVGLSGEGDAQHVAHWIGKLFLLQSGKETEPTPGLSDTDRDFLTLKKSETWQRNVSGGLNLFDIRQKAINFMASGAFTDEERFIPALYASVRPDSKVSSVGEDILKRSSVSLEDARIVNALFHAHADLHVPFRVRILGLLTKSAASTTYFDEVLRVIKSDFAISTSADSGSTMPPAVIASGLPVTAQGLELTKLHRALFEYIGWVSRIAPTKSTFTIGSELIEMLKDFVERQGWPAPEQSLSTGEQALRSKAYESIGLVAHATAFAPGTRLDLTTWLFRSLSEDPSPDVIANVDGALSSLSHLFNPNELEVRLSDRLRAMLLAYMTLSDDPPAVRSARLAAVKWANRCLPFSDVTARWIDILGIAGRRNERSDVVEEGQRGLDPWRYYMNDEKDVQLPDWKEMVKTYFTKIIPHSNASTVGFSQVSTMDVDEPLVFNNLKAEAITALPVAVEYCKHMLFLSALKDFKIEPSWKSQVETMTQNDKKTRDTIRAHLKTLDNPPLLTLLLAAFEGMLKEDTTVAEACGRTFVQIISLSPRAVVGQLADRALDLMPLIRSNKKEIRTLGAQAFGILGAHPANETSSTSIATLKGRLVTTIAEHQVDISKHVLEGAYLALGHFLSRIVYYAPERAQIYTGDIGMIIPMIEIAKLTSVPTQEALINCLSQLWTANIKATEGFDEPEKMIDAYAEWIFSKAKGGNEGAIAALGRLALAIGFGESNENAVVSDGESEANSQFTSKLMEKLYELYELKEAPVHFAIGEAIAAAVGCWDADCVQLTLDVDAADTGRESYAVPARDDRIRTVLDKLLLDCKGTKPAQLKASGIWLFCLINNCSQLEEVQGRLRACQVAFMRLLSARDELVQETASRGLALVYEKGDASLKGALVKDLVSSFTGSGPKLNVEDDTELFDAGALPTGEGGSVTSYKDIVNLANEVGDQSLVYKFMNLATNAATWNTRSAFGRFGLSNIMGEAEIDPKLYPKLYRYRFDPNPNVQRSMEDIWKALVKDAGRVVDAHYADIIEDLLKNMLGKEWRAREASCRAIADIIHGQPFPKYQKYYTTIWANALRVMDDVKGSVRGAAHALCRHLGETLVRQLEDSNQGAAAAAMMREAVPFLLSDKGVDAAAEEVKLTAVITVLRIAKSGGDALRPYLTQLVPRLLDLLSSVEPESINYAYLRSSSSSDSQDKINKLRSAIVNQSPISQALEDCLRFVDGTVMPDLAVELDKAIRAAVSMPTKIGCGRVLGTLCTRHGQEFAPFAAGFLKQMEKQAFDRNDEVSVSYARACAYLLRIATPAARERFADAFTTFYLTCEDELRRQKVADAVLAVSKISPDHFTALEGRLLPFAWLGRHDTDEYVRRELAEVWDAHAGSSRSVARYVPEIVALVARALDTSQWALKHTGALAVAEAVRTVAGAIELSGSADVSNLRALWPTFEKCLALKTFPGKERVLSAFPDFVKRGRPLWAGDEKLAAQLKKIAVREAKRNNAAYRVHAFEVLWKFAEARDDIDMLGDIKDIVCPFLDELVQEDRMDTDEGGADEETAKKAVEAVARGYSRAEMRRDPGAVLEKIIEALKPYVQNTKLDTVRREVWYACIKDVLAEATAAGSAAREDTFLALLDSLDVRQTELGTEDQRATRAKATAEAIKAWKRGAFGHIDEAKVKGAVDTVADARQKERSLEVRALMDEVLTVFKG